MGTYATTTSFSTWLIGTTLDAATTSLVGQCITWAEDEINKKLSKRYDITAFQTTTAVPPLVRSLCQQLATGLFYQHNARGGRDAMERGDYFIKKVQENLADLAANKLDLVNTAGSVIAESSNRLGVLSSTDDYMSTFAEDDPLDWAVDEDKLDDISDERD